MMPSEYSSFHGRVVSAITEPSNGRVRVAVDIDPRHSQDRERLERCVVEGTVVEVVVSKEVE